MTVVDWLLDADPAIRWQVMRDLTHEPADVVAAERAKVATEGWGARLLTLQAPDGLWAPTWWHYDVLRGLDCLRDAGSEADDHIAEAIEVVKRKRDPDGRWPLENVHEGEAHFDMDDGEGKPSRWTTLRAMRVLDWFAQGGQAGRVERVSAADQLAV